MGRAAVFALISLGFCFGQAEPSPNIKALYESQHWPELYRAVETAKGNEFYRGAVGVVFHQNPARSERLLRIAIRNSPYSDEAYQAYEWLSHLFLYTGQYQRLIRAMEQRWTAFPNRPANAGEQGEIASFRGLPDQRVVRVKRSSLKHADQSIFVPITVNGNGASFFFDTGASFFFDTGAWVSSTCESEAKRLGLEFTGAGGSTATMTNRAGFRTAVAKTLVVGGIRLANVSFFVFPNGNEPWSLLPPGSQGIPVIVAFRSLRWEPRGMLEIGGKPERFDLSRSNLRFDNDHLALIARIEKRDVLASVDTGAVSTDLYREFGMEFQETLAQGKKGTTEVRGVGGAESYDSITLPIVQIEIANEKATLRDVGVLMNRGVRSYVGNFGMDLLQQGDVLGIDFSAMRLVIKRRP